MSEMTVLILTSLEFPSCFYQLTHSLLLYLASMDQNQGLEEPTKSCLRAVCAQHLLLPSRSSLKVLPSGGLDSAVNFGCLLCLLMTLSLLHWRFHGLHYIFSVDCVSSRQSLSAMRAALWFTRYCMSSVWSNTDSWRTALRQEAAAWCALVKTLIYRPHRTGFHGRTLNPDSKWTILNERFYIAIVCVAPGLGAFG